MATSDLEIEGQGHKTIAFVALPIYTHIPNLKVLTKIFFKLSHPKGNLCGGGGVTVLNPKYPRLLSGDTMTTEYFEMKPTAIVVIYFKINTSIQPIHCILMFESNHCLYIILENMVHQPTFKLDSLSVTTVLNS